jgi:(1->4)-alpha-D-glucan 1-alpha-D-glucosylmutase
MNERHRTGDLPDRNSEYLLYQTLVGAWPISAERAWTYMEKAAREAKAQTSWLAPAPDFEEALKAFVLGVLGDPEFVGDLEHFIEPVVELGYANSLAQKLLCLTAPGVPDLYQGSELWDLSLVDPDNRRPVDYALRARLLDELETMGPRAAAVTWDRRHEGLPKLLLVWRTLGLRREHPALFDGASYEPLAVAGTQADHVVAFCRGGRVVVVVARLLASPANDWEGITVALPGGRWVDRFTELAVGGGDVPVGRLLSGFPVALLERTG